MGLAQSVSNFVRGEHGVNKRKRIRSENSDSEDSDDSTLNRTLHTRKKKRLMTTSQVCFTLLN